MNPPESRRKAALSAHAVPILEEAEIAQLAKCFADAIPEGEMSVRAGSLLQSLGALFSRVRFAGC